MLVLNGSRASWSTPRIGLVEARNVAFFALALLGQSCRNENPRFDLLRDASTEPSTPSQPDGSEGPEGSGGSVSTVETEPDQSTATDPSSQTTADDSDSTSDPTSEATDSSANLSSSESSGTGTEVPYCNDRAAFCYLVDARDSGTVIQEARGNEAPMTLSHGVMSSHEPGIPTDARVLTVDQDGPAAKSTATWVPPVAQGVAFDAYIKLPSSPVANSLLFGLRGRLILGLNASGGVVCGLNVQSSGYQFSSSGPLELPDTNWHHYGCEYDGEAVTLWVDGQAAVKVLAPAPTSIPEIPIGEVGGDSGLLPVYDKKKKEWVNYGHFHGSISAIRVWTDLAAFRAAMSP